MRKIGEIVSASVINGLEVKLELEPEELKIGYPVIVEGDRFDFYCLVHDIMNPATDIAERLASSKLRGSVVGVEDHETYSGRIFYSKAMLKPIQLIMKDSGRLCEPETIPPYFSEVRHADRKDVNRIYERTKDTLSIGTLRGLSDFSVDIDFKRLTEKPFAIFGRTGAGKSILNKLVCNCILAKDIASVLVFDMQGEYGLYSKSDKTPGLPFFFGSKVETLSLDVGSKDAKPFLMDPNSIRPDDLVVAFQSELSASMIDGIFKIYERRPRDLDLLSAIKNSTEEQYPESVIHPASLNALKRKLSRLSRFTFIRPGAKDGFDLIASHVRDRKSIVLDFGEFGTDQTAYLFVANVLTRRLYELYTERNREFPRLVVFLEEAHKFLDPQISSYTIFGKLARETRKFNLILALVDQRPSKIDDDVRSQLANRLVMSLKEPTDVQSALAGVPDRSMWQNIISTIPVRTAAIIGDAIRVPTVIDIIEYDAENVKKHIKMEGATSEDLENMAKKADEIIKF